MSVGAPVTAADLAPLYARIGASITSLPPETHAAVLPFYNAVKKWRTSDDAAAYQTAGATYAAALEAMSGEAPVQSEEPTPPGELRVHWAAAAFPMLSRLDLAALAQSIAANGLVDPIELLDGEIVDGRNRLAACKLAGIEPTFVDAPAAARADVAEYVIAKNINRRHLDQGQRSAIALALLDPHQTIGATANLQSVGDKVAAAAAALKVSERTVYTAKKVREIAEPEVFAAVAAGDIAPSAALELAALPAEAQRAAAADPKVAKAAVKAIREKRKTVVTAPAETDAPVEIGACPPELAALLENSGEIAKADPKPDVAPIAETAPTAEDFELRQIIKIATEAIGKGSDAYREALDDIAIRTGTGATAPSDPTQGYYSVHFLCERLDLTRDAVLNRERDAEGRDRAAYRELRKHMIAARRGLHLFGLGKVPS